MEPITTRYTKRFGLKTPIVLAPMAGASDAALVGAVISAGGLGILPAGGSSSQKLITDLQSIRQQLGIDKSDDHLWTVGVGFLGWLLDRTEVSNDPRLPKVLDENPAVIWLAFGSDLGKYVRFVREYDEKRGRKEQSARTEVWVIVNSVEQALKAAKEWKVDGLVVQGHDAGGHGGANAPPLFNLLPAVLSALASDKADHPLVVAAGGISTGSQVASLLTLGADAVALGTRFLFTPECLYSDSFKSTLRSAGFGATKRCYLFDEVGGTPPVVTWPEGVDGRAIVNDIVKDWEEGADLVERQKRFDESKQKGDRKREIIWAGVGVGHVDALKPARDVLLELHRGTLAALQGSRALL